MAKLTEVLKNLVMLNPDGDYDITVNQRDTNNKPVSQAHKPEAPPAPPADTIQQNKPAENTGDAAEKNVQDAEYQKLLAEIEALKKANYSLLNHMDIKQEEELTIEQMLFNVCVQDT